MPRLAGNDVARFAAPGHVYLQREHLLPQFLALGAVNELAHFREQVLFLFPMMMLGLFHQHLEFRREGLFFRIEFQQIGQLIGEVLTAVAQSEDGSAPLVEAAVRDKVKALTARFPIYGL